MLVEVPEVALVSKVVEAPSLEQEPVEVAVEVPEAALVPLVLEVVELLSLEEEPVEARVAIAASVEALWEEGPFLRLPRVAFLLIAHPVLLLDNDTTRVEHSQRDKDPIARGVAKSCKAHLLGSHLTQYNLA